jgi:hypothetical protein
VDLSGWKSGDGVGDHWKSSDWTFGYDGKGEEKHQTLWTEKELGDYELIVDYRTEAKDVGEVFVLIHGPGGPAVHLGTDSPGVRKPGEWNRVTAAVHGSELSAALNGTPLPIAMDGRLAGRPGPLGLRSTQKVQFANVYIQPLK